MSATVAAEAGTGPETRMSAPVSVGRLVADVSARLARAGIVDAVAEARDLVAAVCDRPRFWPSLNRDIPVDSGMLVRVDAAARMRAGGAPFAYAVGRAPFRHLTLHVDPRVLIPRQETELLVDLVLQERARRSMAGGVAADIGTGSGAIALALATEGNFDRILATDISLDALAVARANAQELPPGIGTTIEFRPGPGGTPLAGEVLDLLVANPPYIAWDEAPQLPASVRDWEPSAALMCADGGLAVTREIVQVAPALLRSGGLLALEVDSRRAGLAASEVERTGAFHAICVCRDLAGRDRFVLATRS